MSDLDIHPVESSSDKEWVGGYEIMIIRKVTTMLVCSGGFDSVGAGDMDGGVARRKSDRVREISCRGWHPTWSEGGPGDSE